MAELLCFGSGSSGNSYAIKCNNETLLLELGLPCKEILRGLNYNINDVVGCLVSHAHSDHADQSTINKLIQYNIPIYSCEETRKIHKRITTIKKRLKTTIGGFKIQAIPLKHSCECYGYVIEHQEIGKLVFATDCSEFCYRIKNVNHWLIECNWSEDVLIDNMCNDAEMRSRHEQHLELEDTILALKENFSSSVNTIVLLHLSNGNSNEQMFKQRVSEELGFFNIHVAKKDLSLHLEKEEF